MLNSLPWFFLNFFGSQLLKKYNSKRLISTFHLALSLIYFLKNFGGKMTASMLAQPLVYFVAFLTRSKVLVWAASLGTLYSLTGMLRIETLFRVPTWFGLKKQKKCIVYNLNFSLQWSLFQFDGRIGTGRKWIQQPSVHRPCHLGLDQCQVTFLFIILWCVGQEE